MKNTRKRSGEVRAGAAIALALAAVSCGQEAEEPALEGAQRALSAPTRAPVRATEGEVTLITGDRVTLRKAADGKVRPSIQRGPGRDKIAVSVVEVDGELLVVPEDAAKLVAAGALDRALFNVTRLLAEGYGDAERRDLPLVITGAGRPAGLRRQLADDGLTVERELRTLQMVTGRQDKARAAALFSSLGKAGGLAAAGAGPTKVWLDRRLSVSLDHSVPQIGAPAAYARGLDGAGVKVAVLDTGIDASHPDLVGKVVDAIDFAYDGLGTADGVGHGTHVASIIAGSGAASGGSLHGVAPGATLLNGKVCGTYGGCFESAILAGMEWAAQSGADVINMSLGGSDGPELDPLEQAVDQLSAQYGTLFVIAAGNSGYGAGTVSSPGSADASLCVGAVDSTDRRASFSGQGPRVGDHGLKPDLMAPGVGIVAARADGTALGAPVGDFYVRLSGTSMATPHVAGVAALLAQQHPDWKWSQLKAALMGTALPLAQYSVYQQGAGRVDADRATRQGVVAEPASVGFGIAAFPHDDDQPIARSVYYFNHGSEPVQLELAASLNLRGAAAPAGVVSVAPTTLTVPAGGSAEAVVTVDTSLDMADGVYGGALVATSADTRVVTTLGVEREVEKHELTVSVAERGTSAFGLVSVLGLSAEDDAVSEVRELWQPAFGDYKARVPAGTYLVFSSTYSEFSWMVAPRVTVGGATSVVMDTALTKPVAPALPAQDLELTFAGYEYADDEYGIGIGTYASSPMATAEIGATAPAGRVHSGLYLQYESSAQTGREFWLLAHEELDHFFTGWAPTLSASEFARVEAHHAGAAGRLMQKLVMPLSPRMSFFLVMPLGGFVAPFDRVEHYYGPGFDWAATLEEQIEDPQDPTWPLTVAFQESVQSYPAGATTREVWNRGPLGPAFAGRTIYSFTSDLTGAPILEGEWLLINPSLFSDQAKPGRLSRSTIDTGRQRLLRGGEVLEDQEGVSDPYVYRQLPAGRAEYRLEVSATRSPELFSRATSASAAWTFWAEPGQGRQTLALPTVRFSPVLDDQDTTTSRWLVLPFEVERPAEAPKPRVMSARVDVSFDDGATWARAPLLRLGDRGLVVVAHPPGASHVSLRASARDVAGNAVEQTVVRAYHVAP